MDAQTVAKELFEIRVTLGVPQFICIHIEVPSSKSYFLKDYQYLAIHRTRTTVYHLEGFRPVERTNGTLNPTKRICLSGGS